MRENCWLPPEEKDDDSEPKTTQRSEKGSVDGVLKFLVDAVLSNASEGAHFLFVLALFGEVSSE